MDLLEKVAAAGVIGAGGAGFPTHVKLNTNSEFVLLNGAECEPLLRVDQQLMTVYPEEIVKGLLISLQITGAAHAIVGIKKSHPEVIEIMEKAILNIDNASEFVKVAALPDVYPAGDEQVLVYELTGRIVPETDIPISVGCVVINSETAYNIWKAEQDLPVTEKFVTVTGDVPNPNTVKVPVGTPLIELFSAAGRPDLNGYAVINGGPMMGPLLTDEDRYVTKTTKGLIVLPENHSLIVKKRRSMDKAVYVNRSACEQCTICTDLCPRHLLGHSTVPHKMVRAVIYNHPANESMTSALTCCQCNLCEYFSCPAGINPRMANTFYAEKLQEQGIKHRKKEDFKVNFLRDYRQIPSRRLIQRLGLARYDVSAKLNENPNVSLNYVGIGLKDHVGAPAVPCVSIGDLVSKGQKIALPSSGALGAIVHASIDGKVEAIENNLILIRSE
ncbi:MAG: electron transport complex protein RnfC [Ruminococcaceae bacterium]|nr:electron transport complex protein RnfC [Oscillospiraceae bacterium]